MVAAHRYAVLAIGTLAQAATCVFLYGLAALVPRLRSDFGLSLAQSGALVSAPVLGLLLTLVLWGVVADRVGERIVLTVGLTGPGSRSAWLRWRTRRWRSAVCSPSRERRRVR